MKTISISLAAAWSAGVRSFVDGDIFRESNIDLMVGDIADRLGYLKTTISLAALLAGGNTFTGIQTFSGAVVANGTTQLANLTTTGAATAASVAVTGALTASTITTSGNIVSNGDIRISAAGTALTIGSMMQHTVTYLGDVNSTLPASPSRMWRVPAITANRTYTLPTSVGAGTVVRIVRVRVADAFTVTVNDPAAVAMGMINISREGFIECHDTPAGWRLLDFGGSVTSLSVVA